MDRAELYRGPLEDFVARRTASVRELRTKDPEAAAIIGKLRKPPVGVWAIDQLAVDKPALVAELLAAGADVRDAQQNVAVGSESREALLAVTTRLRDLVDTAARAAADVLERAGKGASAESDRRIRATLQSAATGRAAERNALWTGTLDRDLEIAGFGSLDEPEDDPAELAETLAPLRRLSPSEFRRPVQDQPSPKFEVLARRDAEREAAGLEAVAQHARASADASGVRRTAWLPKPSSLRQRRPPPRSPPPRPRRLPERRASRWMRSPQPNPAAHRTGLADGVRVSACYAARSN